MRSFIVNNRILHAISQEHARSLNKCIDAQHAKYIRDTFVRRIATGIDLSWKQARFAGNLYL